MNIIKFVKTSQFKTEIYASSEILRKLRAYAISISIEFKYDHKDKTRTRIAKFNTHIKLNRKETIATCYEGLAKILIDHINMKLLFIDKVKIEIDPILKNRIYGDPDKLIDIIPKWKNIYKTNPKGKERALMQLTDSSKIVESNRGVISLFTSYGKSELILGIAESYLSQFKQNCAIFVFSNSVKEEIILRGKHYGIELTDLINPSARINIINPVGFMKSTQSKEESILEWLKNVDCILADEAHHYSANSWLKCIELSDPYFSYGFTATADVDKGLELSKETIEFRKITPQIVSLLSCTGYYLVNRSLPIPVKILRKRLCLFSENKIRETFNLFPTYPMKVIQDLVSSKPFAEEISKIYKMYLYKGICFIPVITIESSVQLARNLNKLGIKAISWSSELSTIPGLNGDSEVAVDLTLKALKELSKIKAFDVLIATTVGTEGIDLSNLNSIIPISGNSYRMLIQPVGRAARNESVTIVFLWDKYNAILNKQMTAKYRIVKSCLNVVSDQVLE